MCDLVFQVITDREAERRGKSYDAEGMTYLFDLGYSSSLKSKSNSYDAEGMTYLFDLDFNDEEYPFTVDAGSCGNVSHFVNHSVSLLYPFPLPLFHYSF